MIISVDPKYVTFNTTVENGKTVVKASIEKAGLPENTNKIKVVYEYLKGKTYTGEPTESETKEFTITQNDLPFVTEWEIPTEGPVTLEVLKEVNVEEEVTETQEVNAISFTSANANLVQIDGGANALVTVDDNGIRMKDCYVDTPINLQQFAGGSNGVPVQGQVFEWDSQMIQTTCDLNLNSINLSDFAGLSVTGSVGPNNYIGLVIRPTTTGSDFGDGISYDFDENRWMINLSDNYNMASWPTQKRINSGINAQYLFDTDFITTFSPYSISKLYPNGDGVYSAPSGVTTGFNPYEAFIYTDRSIPINRVKDIPASKWQELFNMNLTSIDFSSKSEWNYGGYNTGIPITVGPIDPAKARISFVFAAGDYTQPCRITKLAAKTMSTSTVTSSQKQPALTPDDFNYSIITKTGKSAVRFEWSGWQINMTGNIYCKNNYYPI